MADIEIASESLRCVLSTQGGTIWRLEADLGDGWQPLLRPPPEGPDRDPLKAGCFPLVPFGNRVEGNRFLFDRTEYHLKPNTPWDKHYLHGDGWLGDWTIDDRGDAEASLSFEFEGELYRYRATQRFQCEGPSFRAILGVTNLGERPMPFGLGWHPYFPLTPATTLAAPATACWTEKAGWLPDTRTPVPEALDFKHPRMLPRRWVNNGFEGWDGAASVVWPEQHMRLEIETAPALSRYFLFVSDREFDPDYREDFFCFEPMSHSANGHNLPDFGGLTVLAPGQGMAVSMTLSCGVTKDPR
ncbi:MULTISPECIES: aldose 1-epimerase [unclassified Mesorhizobium]|uniref:aldose 1-epimerase n=1 Tax=unclassified Mesorhizobium TaxID=325217 RepID=UPI00112B5B4E|nr:MULTISPECIES: aldose 1-epimerase [unclassified Mesorhizobium]TPK97082.1 aldose 1-epimerase [Mesorhizobium sp. B2-4-16]TPL73181.1 aldose 1-epimerase [Mesorhizobium sp. B2-4-3]